MLDPSSLLTALFQEAFMAWYLSPALSCYRKSWPLLGYWLVGAHSNGAFCEDPR